MPNKTEKTLLFKFCSAAGAAAILRGQTVFVTSPLDFNDPFEMRPGWTNEHSQRQVRDREVRNQIVQGTPLFVATKAGLVKGGSLPASPPDAMLSRVDSQFGIADMHNRGVFSEMHRSFRVLCLVSGILDDERAESDDTLMWAHYADQFQGVCLALDSTKFFNGISAGGYKVNYCPDRQSLPPASYDVWHQLQQGPAPNGYVTDPGSGLDLTPRQQAELNQHRYINLLTHKSPAWKYENEVRMIYDYPALAASAHYKRFETACEKCKGDKRPAKECENPVFRDAIVLPVDAVRAVIFGTDSPLDSVKSVFDVLSDPAFAHVATYWSDLHPAKYTVRYQESDRSYIEMMQRMRTEHVAYAKHHLESDGNNGFKIKAARKGVNFLPRRRIDSAPL